MAIDFIEDKIKANSKKIERVCIEVLSSFEYFHKKAFPYLLGLVKVMVPEGLVFIVIVVLVYLVN